ncbi:terminase small subunit [Edwardsiella tarda]
MAVGLTDTLSRCRSRAGGIHSAQWPGVLLDHLACLNSTQAAIRAGYSEKTAKEQAARLLTNVNVQTFVAELKATRVAELKAEQEQSYPRLLEPEKT